MSGFTRSQRQFWDAFAVDYERCRESATALVAATLHQQLHLGRAASVLEVGAGAGAGALDLSSRLPPDARLVSTDFSPVMLELARHKLSACRGRGAWLACRGGGRRCAAASLPQCRLRSLRVQPDADAGRKPGGRRRGGCTRAAARRVRRLERVGTAAAQPPAHALLRRAACAGHRAAPGRHAAHALPSGTAGVIRPAAENGWIHADRHLVHCRVSKRWRTALRLRKTSFAPRAPHGSWIAASCRQSRRSWRSSPTSGWHRADRSRWTCCWRQRERPEIRFIRYVFVNSRSYIAGPSI